MGSLRFRRTWSPYGLRIIGGRRKDRGDGMTGGNFGGWGPSGTSEPEIY